MNNKKSLGFLCGFRALAAYSAISFFWLAFISMTVNSNENLGISSFADRLLFSNLAIALFSVVYGFSALIMRAQKLSNPAKYSLHILVNYITAMVSVYALFSNVSDSYVTPKTWIVMVLVATVIFFVIYGVVMLSINLIKKKLK